MRAFFLFLAHRHSRRIQWQNYPRIRLQAQLYAQIFRIHDLDRQALGSKEFLVCTLQLADFHRIRTSLRHCASNQRYAFDRVANDARHARQIQGGEPAHHASNGAPRLIALLRSVQTVDEFKKLILHDTECFQRWCPRTGERLAGRE
jgi:hypothetical protein